MAQVIVALGMVAGTAHGGAPPTPPPSSAPSLPPISLYEPAGRRPAQLSKGDIRCAFGDYEQEIIATCVTRIAWEGTATAKFTALPEGGIGDAKVDLDPPSRDHPEIAECVLRQLRHYVHFRRFTGPAMSLVFPLRLKGPRPPGSLDKEVIRRVIRLHVPEVKKCYEVELALRPELAGCTIVQFIVGGSGAVISSELQSSTLGSPEAERCIVAAVRSWQFPKPAGGGIVQVSYPFVLKWPGPEADAPAQATTPQDATRPAH